MTKTVAQVLAEENVKTDDIVGNNQYKWRVKEWMGDYQLFNVDPEATSGIPEIDTWLAKVVTIEYLRVVERTKPTKVAPAVYYRGRLRISDELFCCEAEAKKKFDGHPANGDLVKWLGGTSYEIDLEEEKK